MIDFSGIRKSSVLGRLLRLPLAFVPRHAVVRILQGELRGWRWVAGASTHGCWLGSYEMPKQLSYVRAIDSGQIVYDIGANVGFYTLLAAKCVSKSGKVFAFEPLPGNVSILEKHIKLNRCQNISIHAVAISERSGKMKFQNARNRSMGHLAAEGELEVNVISLDEFIYHAGHPVPNVMKIDVEGEELGVLRGALKLLSSSPPIIFLATHGLEIHAACCDLLKAHGYKLEKLGGGSVETTDELICIPGPI